MRFIESYKAGFICLSANEVFELIEHEEPIDAIAIKVFIRATLRLSVCRKMKYYSFSSGCLLRFSAFFWSPGSKRVHPTPQATTKYSVLLSGNFLFLRETINTFF